jgi:hypothetical protein
VHDSQVFSDIYKETSERFPEIEAVVIDAGYKTPGICREIIKAEKLPVMPYKRPMTKKVTLENTNLFTTSIMIAIFAPKARS